MAIVVVMGQQLSFRNFSNRYELDGVSFCSQASPTKLAARASAGNLCEESRMRLQPERACSVKAQDCIDCFQLRVFKADTRWTFKADTRWI